MKALEVYEGSDGELTKRYYAELEERGAWGVVAVNLFRAQKNSTLAKVYRGGVKGIGSYRSMAYDRKQWAMQNLVHALLKHAASLGISWGWKHDPKAFGPAEVLYIVLHTGQVSFHSPARLEGPDFDGNWDGQHKSAERILKFCDQVFHQPHPDQMELISKEEMSR